MTKAAAVVNPNQKTYAFLILDKSGSMGYCLVPTIMGFNEQIQTIKSESKDNGEWFVSVITFNQKVDAPAENWCVSAEAVEEINETTYVPNGSTAMLDAVGSTLARIKASTPYTDPNVSYLIVIISDGQENASREYNWSSVGELVQELQATKRFTFTYMGANQDLGVINNALHIPAGNMANYRSDAVGTACALHAHSSGTREYMKARRRGLAAVESFYSDDAKPADFSKMTDPSKEIKNDSSVA